MATDSTQDTPTRSDLPAQGGARLLQADAPTQDSPVVVPIRRAEIGKAESPQNEELAGLTEAQLRQLVTDTRRQLANLAVRLQEEQGRANNSYRELREASEDLAAHVGATQELRRRLDDALEAAERYRSDLFVAETELQELRKLRAAVSGSKRSLVSAVFRMIADRFDGGKH